MFGKTQHDRASEQAEFQFRQRALKSLMSMRNKQLRESLDHRIKRARRGGAWTDLTRAECESLHKQEKASAQEQLAILQLACARTRWQLTESRRAMARSRRAIAKGPNLQTAGRLLSVLFFSCKTAPRPFVHELPRLHELLAVADLL